MIRQGVLMSLILLDIRGLDLIFCYNLGCVGLTIQNGGEQMKYIHPTSGIFINYLFGQEEDSLLIFDC